MGGDEDRGGGKVCPQITWGLLGHSKDLGFTLNEMGNHCEVWSKGVINCLLFPEAHSRRCVENRTVGQGQGNQLEATVIIRVKDG